MAPRFDNLRPGYPIVPPAIARHLVFRLPISKNPRWKTSTGDWEGLWRGLCHRIAKHANQLRGVYDGPDVEIVRPGEPFDASRGCFSAESSFLIPINLIPKKQGYRLRIRVDVHTELLGLTYIFDHIDAASPLGKRLALLTDDVPGKSPASNWLFDGMWTPGRRGAFKVPAARVLSEWLQGEGKPAEAPPGPLITDFRGIIILPSSNRHMDQTDVEEADTTYVAEKRLHEVLAKFAKTHDQLIEAIADPNSMERNARDARDLSGHAVASGGEAVVCGMLDGKALYAASLGEWGPQVTSPQPIRHLLVYAGRSYSQLGRLVRRMQVLGELRHAAIMDYDPDQPGGEKGLREASRAIRVLGGELTKATPFITTGKTERSAGSPASESLDPAEGPSKDLGYFVNELATISDAVGGGLTHRIEQSRYYAQQFQAEIDHLRQVRIGDWQPYDDFVQRYILHLFARIDRIGNRYEALGRRVDRLLFFQQAKLLDSYTKSVDSTVQEIHKSTAALNRSAAQQTKASKKQVHLLEGAEYFALVFLIYYVGSVFKFALEGHAIPGIDKTYFLQIWFVLIVTLGLVVAFYIGKRIFSARIRRLRRRARVRFVRWRRNQASRSVSVRDLPAAGASEGKA